MLTPGKINLYLEITGVRPDGYHELRTLFLPLQNLSDEVTLEDTGHPGLSMDCDGEFAVEPDEHNLCMKAAGKFASHFSLSPSWHIRLRKHIPVAAGLGGGSSDAAAVLRLLSEHCGLQDHPDLPVLAASLGADVPFFLQDHPAVGTGIGDILAPLPRRRQPLELLLINPGFPLPVQWVYKHAYRPETPAMPDFDRLLSLWENGSPDELAPCLWNDLEACVFDKFPILQMLRSHLLDNGAARVLMSGSGPTIFAVCRNNAAELSRGVEKEFGDQLHQFICRV